MCQCQKLWQLIWEWTKLLQQKGCSFWPPCNTIISTSGLHLTPLDMSELLHMWSKIYIMTVCNISVLNYQHLTSYGLLNNVGVPVPEVWCVRHFQPFLMLNNFGLNKDRNLKFSAFTQLVLFYRKIQKCIHLLYYPVIQKLTENTCELFKCHF